MAILHLFVILHLFIVVSDLFVAILHLAVVNCVSLWSLDRLSNKSVCSFS